MKCGDVLCLLILYAVGLSGLVVCIIGITAGPVDGDCIRPGSSCIKSSDCSACITPGLTCSDFQIGPSGAWCGENATVAAGCTKCTCYSAAEGFACGTFDKHDAPHKPIYIGFLIVSVLFLMGAAWATFMTWLCSGH